MNLNGSGKNLMYNNLYMYIYYIDREKEKEGKRMHK